MIDNETITAILNSWPNVGPLLIICYLALNKFVTVLKEHRSLVEAIDELKIAVKEQTESFHKFTVCMEKVVSNGKEGN